MYNSDDHRFKVTVFPWQIHNTIAQAGPLNRAIIYKQTLRKVLVSKYCDQFYKI